MATKRIDSYHYCYEPDQEKRKFYEEHKYTEEEQEKARKLFDRVLSFTEKTGKASKELLEASPEGQIKFFNGLGYISINNFDRDEMTIIHYGNTEEEAYWNALIDFEFFISENWEWANRQELEADYQRRFVTAVC